MVVDEVISTLRKPDNLIRALWGGNLWDGARRIIHAIYNAPRVVIIGANGVGKSHAIAYAAMHYFLTNPEAMVVVSSASWGQLQRGLWRYITGLARVIPGIRVTQDKVEGGDRRMWAISTNTRERLQGLHGSHVMVIVDEGSGVPDWLPEVAMAMAPEKIVYSGNPLEPRGPLWEAWNDPLYTRLAISALDFPNVVKGRVVYQGGITREVIEEIRARYGEDSPVYVARVLGQFPEGMENVVIPWTIIATATQRTPEDGGDVSMGVDVARGGGDQTALVVIRGNAVSYMETWDYGDLMATTGRIKSIWDMVGQPVVIIDETGLGGGVVDRLKEQGLPVRGINFGASATQSGRFANMRAELWWTLREALVEWLAIPDDRRLHDDLASARYSYDSKGRIRLEPKSELSHSPDLGDALALAVWGRANRSVNIWLDLVEKLS